VAKYHQHGNKQMESIGPTRLAHHRLIEAGRRFPEKTAIVSDGRKLSYEGFLRRVSALSTILRDAGLNRGDRALILLSDKTNFLVASYAVIAQGAIAVPLIDRSPPITIERIVQDCAPHLLITSSKDLADARLVNHRASYTVCFVEKSLGGIARRGSSKVIVFGSGTEHGSVDLQDLTDFGQDGGALILYASGATGKKEGVLLSHRNLVQVSQNVNEFTGIDSNISEFVISPLDHSFGFVRSLCIFLAGGTVVVNNGSLNPVSLVQSVLRDKCDAISSVTSDFTMFFGRLESLLRRIGSQIKYFEFGSAPMPLDHEIRLLEIFPKAHICMHYGLTEAPCSTFIDLRKERRKLHTVGHPSPNVAISISDDQGQKLGGMQMGEILVRGDHVAVGYWRNDEAHAQRFTGDNWFKTGDYGFIDEEGYLHLLGRKDEMIDMGGHKISPIEVEDRIREVYPNCEICVVGVPDPDGILGEIPVLCYVAKDGKTVTPWGLSRALSACLDGNKIPRVVYRVESLPRAENARMLRSQLRKKIIAGMAHEIEQAQE
jgi:long-chain acyl-CoA synthetase